MATAVVFAYHDVGVRCLSVLLAQGIDVRLVVTHRDNPNETIWFASVEKLARQRGIAVDTPRDPNEAAFVARVQAIAPDFLFSFYYRQMLAPALLACAKRGAFNMHGSLLPKYRGRVPVNWAVLNGERETGATLHEMVEKPDAGRIVDREAVPIGDNDVAAQVFARVTDAAETVLARSLPRLLDGSASLTAQDLGQGGYFTGRRPEDGRIDWAKGAWEVHNLVRAVAPPYPGAFTALEGGKAGILGSCWGEAPAGLPARGDPGTIAVCEGRCYALCGDGRWLQLTVVDLPGMGKLDGAALAAFFAGRGARMGQ
jgi:methionyl-tRNA formyltransferase